MDGSNKIQSSSIYDDFQSSGTSEVSHPTTSYSRPFLASSVGRGNTAATGQQPPTTARPLTSKQGTGFTRSTSQSAKSALFDPLNQGAQQASNQEKNPQELRREYETKINALLNECYLAYANGNHPHALELAKELQKRERQMNRDTSDKHPNVIPFNPDLNFCIHFTLANMYAINKFYQEALNTLQSMISSNDQSASSSSTTGGNKLQSFSHGGRLRVTMGNLYFEQGKYTQAIKMFQMALDSIPNTSQTLRMKILMNIGQSYLRMSQIQDAITCFQTISETSQTMGEAVYNLLICFYAIEEVEKMKKTFQRLVYLELPILDRQLEDGERADGLSVVMQDELREYAKQARHDSEQRVLNAARLIAPLIEPSFEDGFNWVIDTVKTSPLAKVADDIEIAKAQYLVHIQQFDRAVELLKDFEKKGSDRISAASTNLSALMLGRKDLNQAEKYAEQAVKAGRFNIKAANNMALCNLLQKDYGKAVDLFKDVLLVDPTLAETLFNIGLALKSAGNNVEALRYFEKLNELLPQDTEVIFHIADIHEMLENRQQAFEWYSRAVSINPTDPDILVAVGKLHAKNGDKVQAFHYHSEAYRYCPDNLDLITWLGGYFVEHEMYEQAIQVFYRASLTQPKEVKWQLMIASCMRRSGNYQQALARYKKTHELYPDSVECLRFLYRLCSDMGIPEAQEYGKKLHEMERKDRMNSLVPPTLDGSFDTKSRLDSVISQSNSFRHDLNGNSKTSSELNVSQTATGTMNLHNANAGGNVTVPKAEIQWDDVNVSSLLPD